MTQRTASDRLDPRQPFVLDTRELGRRPGSMRPVHRQVTTRERMGIELVGVPAGATVELDLRLESVMEGVLVTGTATGPLTGECGRCLDPLPPDERLTVDLQELFAYPDSTTEATTDDDETGRMVGDLLDLEPAVRDALVLALPLTPVCSPDCEGLCAECGERLAALPSDHRHDTPDPRWAGLRDLLPANGADRPGAGTPAGPAH